MAIHDNKSRDGWDKLEIIIKFFNGIVIAMLTLVIGCGTQKVADSIKFGELTQKLIQDLALRDSNSTVRRDLSLITLNRTIGDEKPQMLADMSEVIYLSDSTREKEKNIARKILEERDLERFKKITNDRDRQRLINLATSISRTNVISIASASKTDSNPLPEVTIKAVDEIYSSLRGTATTIVYIQTNKPAKWIAPVADTLRNLGYQVPQAEIITKPFTSSLRYFNMEDAVTASEIAGILKIKGIVKGIHIQKLNNPANKIPEGQIEVWLKQ